MAGWFAHRRSNQSEPDDEYLSEHSAGATQHVSTVGVSSMAQSNVRMTAEKSADRTTGSQAETMVGSSLRSVTGQVRGWPNEDAHCPLDGRPIDHMRVRLGRCSVGVSGSPTEHRERGGGYWLCSGEFGSSRPQYGFGRHLASTSVPAVRSMRSVVIRPVLEGLNSDRARQGPR